MKADQQNTECVFMTITDVKVYLNISLSAAYQLSRRKDFPVCRIGGSIRIPRDAFLCWVESRTYIPTNLAERAVR